MLDPALLTAATRVSGLVLQMTISVVLGFVLGGWLDRRFGTSPLFLLAFGIGGLILGFWRMNTELQKARKKE